VTGEPKPTSMPSLVSRYKMMALLLISPPSKRPHSGKDVKAEYYWRGFDSVRQPVVLGDGAKWIWTLADQHFPTATQIVDVLNPRTVDLRPQGPRSSRQLGRNQEPGRDVPCARGEAYKSAPPASLADALPPNHTMSNVE